MFVQHEKLYRPMPLLTYLKGGGADGQHSASLGNVIEITQATTVPGSHAETNGYSAGKLVIE